jgi:hypothetical protein
MTEQERALDGLLREFARAGSGTDQKFIDCVLTRIRKQNRYSFKNNPRRGLRWLKYLIVLAGAVFLGVIALLMLPNRNTTISVAESSEFLSSVAAEKGKRTDVGEILYRGNFSPELSDWVGVASIVYDFSKAFDEHITLGSATIKTNINKIIRPIVSKMNREKLMGMEIRCENIERSSLIGVHLKKAFDEDNIEIEFDMRVLSFDERSKGRWGFHGIGIHGDINNLKPRVHLLLDERRWFFQEIEKKNWVRLRFVIRKVLGQNGAVNTSQECFCNDKLYLAARIERAGNRYSIGQIGISTEITNFYVRRIAPSTNPPGL